VRRRQFGRQCLRRLPERVITHVHQPAGGFDDQRIANTLTAEHAARPVVGLAGLTEFGPSGCQDVGSGGRPQPKRLVVTGLKDLPALTGDVVQGGSGRGVERFAQSGRRPLHAVGDIGKHDGVVGRRQPGRRAQDPVDTPESDRRHGQEQQIEPDHGDLRLPRGYL